MEQPVRKDPQVLPVQRELQVNRYSMERLRL
jgi:hypothetical protein